MADNDVEIKFGASTGDLKDGVEQSKAALASLRETVDSVGETLKGLAEIAGVAVSVDAFKGWVESATELGEHIERVAAQMGVSAQQASELSGIAKLTGTDFGSLARDVERFQLNLSRAGSASAPVAQGLKALGVSAKEFIGIPIPEQLNLLADAVSRFGDGGTKTAAILALLGRNGVEMLPFLDRGREGMEELRAVMARTGAVMSNEMADGFARTKEDISEMSLAWEGLSNRLYAVVNPAIDAAIKKLTQMMETLTPDKVRADVVGVVDAMAAVASGLGGLAISVSGFFEQAGADIEKVIDLAHELVGPLEAVAKWENEHVEQPLERMRASMLGGLAPPAPGGVAQGPYGALGTGPGSQTTDSKILALDRSIDNWRKSLEGLLGAGHTGEQFGPFKPPKPQAGTMDLGGGNRGSDKGDKGAKQQLAANIEAYNADIQAIHAAISEKERALNDELNHHQITTKEWLAQSLSALNDEKTGTQQAYADELTQLGLTVDKIAEIHKREAADIQKVNKQIADDTRKAADATLKAWQDVGQEIGSAFSGQVSGLLKGTETFATAAKSIFAQLVTQLIEELAKLAVEEAVVFAVTGSFGSVGGLGGGLLGDIGKIAGFDSGTSYVPTTGLALLHQAEMVIPAGVAQAWRDGGIGAPQGGGSSNGGGTTIIHNHHYYGALMDAKSVTRAVVAHQKSNPTSQGDW